MAMSRKIEKKSAESSMISAGYMVRATYLAVTRVLQHRLKVYELTSPQWYFMREIWIQSLFGKFKQDCLAFSP